MRVRRRISRHVGDVECLQRRSITAERLDDGDVVESHQPEERMVGFAGGTREIVVTQHVDVLHSRVLADLLEDRRRKYL